MARSFVPHKRGIYKITNTTNGKFYIGSSIHITKRWWEHKKWLRLKKHDNPHMQNAWVLHGENNFKFEILFDMPFDSREKILSKEQEIINEYYDNGNRCYNLSKNTDKPDCEKNKIPILQIDKDTRKVIREWPSASDVERELGIGAGCIYNACKGRLITFGGYRWIYADKERASKYIVKEGKHGGHNKRSVICLNDGKFYDSVAEAAMSYSVRYTEIISVCTNRFEHIKSLKFKYSTDENHTLENDIKRQACIICKISFSNARSFATHVQFFHKITTEQYTIDYCLNGIRPLCKYEKCLNSVRYVSFGFKDYCKDHSSLAESDAGKKGQRIKKQNNLNKVRIMTNNITISQDPYDYGDTVCLKWHGNDITKDYTKSLSEEEREKLVLELFDFYRYTGFPYPRHKDLAMSKEWAKLKAKSIEADSAKQISNKNRAGMDIVQHFTAEQFYNVSSDSAPSMLEAFNTDKTLMAVLKNRIVRYFGYFNIHGAMLRQGFRSTRSSAVVSNFNCLLAKYFYENYSKNGDWVYDYSMGFGQRMIAAMSCGRNYVACDPWTANIESGHKIKEFIGGIDSDVKNFAVELNNVGSETYCPEDKKGKFSLAFSSPPYFSKEIYDKSENGQSTDGRGYQEWIDGWWDTVVKNIDGLLSKDGVFILNMVSVLDGKHNILDDMLKVCKAHGFEEVDRYFIQMSHGHFTKYKKSAEEREDFIHKSEPIVVMRRV